MKDHALEWMSEIQQVVIANLENEEEDVEVAFDDLSGKELPIAKVRAARTEEVKYMKSRNQWTVVDETVCWQATGKAPVPIRWVDVNKGSDEDMNVRCRLVAKDFKGNDKDRDDLFAETPPLEAKRMQFSLAATKTKSGRQRGKEDGKDRSRSPLRPYTGTGDPAKSGG